MVAACLPGSRGFREQAEIQLRVDVPAADHEDDVAGPGASDAAGASVEAVGDGAADAGAATFVMVDEQITSAPPPLVEPLHWLMVTP